MSTLRRAGRQFGWYLVNGGIATGLDWSVFAVLRGPCGIDYRLAVAASFVCGAVCNFELQKHITFGDRGKRGSAQVAVYLAIVAFALVATLGLMMVFVRLGMNSMVARITTTGVMMVANFFMHRSLTFNQRFFQRLAREAPESERVELPVL